MICNFKKKEPQNKVKNIYLIIAYNILDGAQKKFSNNNSQISKHSSR